MKNEAPRPRAWYLALFARGAKSSTEDHHASTGKPVVFWCCDKKIISLIIIAAVLLLAVLVYLGLGRNQNNSSQAPVSPPVGGSGQFSANLQPQTSQEAGVSFEVLPIDFEFGKPVKFEIKIDTHAGSLNFDLTKISSLEDDGGNSYQPLSWQDASSSSHHISGILSFAALKGEPSSMKLVVQDTPPRIFTWELK